MKTPIEYLELMASAISEKTGVKIQSGKTWRADIKNHILEYKPEDLINLDFSIAKGLLLHELGHINYTGITEPTSLQKKYPASMQNCYNCLEDKRIERKLRYDLGDFSDIPIKNLNAFFDEYNIKQNVFKKMPKLRQFLHLTSMFTEAKTNELSIDKIGYEANKILSSNGHNILLENLFDEDIKKKFLDNFNKIYDITDEIVGASSFQDVKQIVDTELYPIIEEYLEENEEKSKSESDESENSLDKSKALQKLSNTASGSFVKLTESFKKLNPKKVTEPEAQLELRSYVNTLTQRIKGILEYRKAVRYTGNKIQGKLLNKNIFKIATNDNRIFSKRQNLDLPDKYNFYIVIDASGSMTDKDKVYYAMLSGYLIKFLTENLNLTYKVISFSDNNSTKFINDISSYELLNGGTIDEKAFELIKDDIKTQNKDISNIIIELTDGDICNSFFRQALINELETKLKTVIIGIGIGKGILPDHLKAMFKNNIYLPDISQLPNELLNVLKQLIRN